MLMERGASDQNAIKVDEDKWESLQQELPKAERSSKGSFAHISGVHQYLVVPTNEIYL